MALLPLVLALSLGASDQTIPAGCREDYGTCREDCTIDYGGVTTKYKQLGQCVDTCNRERDACTTRHYSLRDTGGDLPTTPSARPPLDEWEQRESSGGGRTVPASTTAPDSGRRGVYRASEAAAPAAPAASDDLRDDTEERAAPAAPPPAPAPLAPEPPAPVMKPAAPPPLPPAPAASAQAPSEEGAEEPPPPPRVNAPPPRPTEPVRPTPPPEPKKRDIADWDPDAED